jgi:hypothetical protein
MHACWRRTTRGEDVSVNRLQPQLLADRLVELRGQSASGDVLGRRRRRARWLARLSGSVVQRIEVRAEHFLDNRAHGHPFSTVGMLIEGKELDTQQQLHVQTYDLEVLGRGRLARNFQIGVLQKRVQRSLDDAGRRSSGFGALD